ncbi:hypothetical protein [Eubacterium pyruvativorans]|uniref:hypothetical protein n=1 Tax=Eubacterium pyruvativorans TaxID=155865 RepID=UPI0015690B32|nr:hypothetical protein [Eubacterium pyruvativorans]
MSTAVQNKKNEITGVNAFSNLADGSVENFIGDELNGIHLTFDRIKIPIGGVTSFEIPGEEEDETVSVKEISGVILYHHPMFAYYQDKYTGGSNPPDCGSMDGVTGVGVPGGACAKCPYNQFGSGENGSKRCKNKRRIYILREGEIFPMILSIPTGSLKSFTRYIKRLLTKGKKTNMVVTRFTLKKAVNMGGIAYTQVQFGVDRVLNPEEQKVINDMATQVKAMSISVGYDTGFEEAEEDFPIDPETGEIIEPLR